MTKFLAGRLYIMFLSTKKLYELTTNFEDKCWPWQVYMSRKLPWSTKDKPTTGTHTPGWCVHTRDPGTRSKRGRVRRWTTSRRSVSSSFDPRQARCLSRAEDWHWRRAVPECSAGPARSLRPSPSRRFQADWFERWRISCFRCGRSWRSTEGPTGRSNGGCRSVDPSLPASGARSAGNIGRLVRTEPWM